jgi:hypothetical protein
MAVPVASGTTTVREWTGAGTALPTGRESAYFHFTVRGDLLYWRMHRISFQFRQLDLIEVIGNHVDLFATRLMNHVQAWR